MTLEEAKSIVLKKFPKAQAIEESGYVWHRIKSNGRGDGWLIGSSNEEDAWVGSVRYIQNKWPPKPIDDLIELVKEVSNVR